MNVFIITMDDPVQTNSFISKIIENSRPKIVGLAVAQGGRLTLRKGKSRIGYILSLLMIMGIAGFVRNSIVTLTFKARRALNGIFPKLVSNPSIATVAQRHGIKTWKIRTPNNPDFLEDLKKLQIDVIINQSQNMLKKELLSIPRVGVINRHNALLPRNRGRLTPFWVLYKEEKETGVSIHFVTRELDAGDIIVQKRFPILMSDNFNSIVRKNYELAPIAMLEALEKLEQGDNHFIKNDSMFATYNSTPSLREALVYRKRRVMRALTRQNA